MRPVDARPAIARPSTAADDPAPPLPRTTYQGSDADAQYPRASMSATAPPNTQGYHQPSPPDASTSQRAGTLPAAKAPPRAAYPRPPPADPGPHDHDAARANPSHD